MNNILRSKLSGKYHVLATAASAWTVLGAYRGYASYKHNHQKKVIDCQERIKENKEHLKKGYTSYYDEDRLKPEPFFYSDAAIHAMVGIFFYVNPMLFLFMAYNELLRLEINVRGLEEEKKKDSYYRLL